jgi:hypothetical protein
LVAFDSYASNLDWKQEGGFVYVHDRVTSTNALVSVASDGTLGNARSRSASMSSDGRFVAFESYASNLVENDDNYYCDIDLDGEFDDNCTDIFVHEFDYLADSDGDGCTNARERGWDATLGGRRDPTNPWDYFNPTNDGKNRVDDILMVVNQYFVDHPDPEYTYATDRTLIAENVAAGTPWQLGEPNGQQRVDDILAAVESYFHDCWTGSRNLPNPSWWPEGKAKPLTAAAQP